MTNAKSTKRALLASILSVAVCCAMLIGTTFAWFTDSVTSGKNKIVAGNLDVELYHANGNTPEEKVTETTKLFVNKDGENVLWEPGVMIYENFTVKNVGSLALKYKLTLNAECNTVDGKSLADVLKVAILDTAFSGEREEAIKLNFKDTIYDFEKPGNLAADDAGKAGDTYAVVIYWEPSANDNDYNFNNDRKDFEQLYVDFGVNLVAAQDTVENDSFGNDYDAGAELPVTTQSDFVKALDAAESGDKLMLSAGKYEMPVSQYTIPAGISIIGDNNTVLVVDGGKTENPGAQTSNRGVNISGDGVTIKNVAINGINVGSNQYDAFVRISGNNVTLDNVKINSATNATPIVIASTSGDDNNITIKNCNITAAFKAIHIVDGTRGTVTVDGCNIDAVYPINANTNSQFKLSVMNSVLKGWTSYGESVINATFNNCEFGIGHGYGYVVAYADTDFVNCKFNKDFLAQTKNNYIKTMTFTNCFKEEVKITAENIKEQFHADNDKDSIDQATGWTVLVDGVAVQ